MPRTLTMPVHRAKMMAQAVLPHVASEDVTPTLTLAAVRDGKVYASDRYSVAEFSLIPQEPPGGFAGWEVERRSAWLRDNAAVQEGSLAEDDPTWAEDFTIPRAALRRIATLSKAQTVSGFTDRHVVRVREEFTPWRTLSPALPNGGGARRARGRTIVVEMVDGETVDYAQRFHVPSGTWKYPPVGRLFSDWKPMEGAPATFGLTGLNLDKVVKFAGKHEPLKITLGGPEGPAGKTAPMLVEVGSDFRALLQPVHLAHR